MSTFGFGFLSLSDSAQTRKQITDMVEGAPVRGAPPESLDLLLAEMRELAEKRVAEFEGDDDDVIPMTHVEGETRTVFFVHPFHGDDEQRFVYETLVPEVCKAARARCFVSVQPIWFAPEADKLPEGMRPREHPDSREGLVVLGCDGERFVQYLTEVRREPEPEIVGWMPGEERRPEEAGWVAREAAFQLLYTRVARASRLWLMQQPLEWWTPERRSAYLAFGRALESVAEADDPNAATTENARDAEFVDAWRTLYGGEGLPDDLMAMTRREDFWSIPEPECDTPAAGLRMAP